TLARRVCVPFFSFADAANAPVAPVFVEASFFEPSEITTDAPGAPMPAAETLPENVTLPPLPALAANVKVGCASIPSASTVPAGFGVAVPATYGVKMLGQVAIGAVDAAKTPSTVKFTSSSFAPNAAPPADCGMSGEGRQTVSLPEPNAVSAPAVGSTQAGTCRVWPAAER